MGARPRGVLMGVLGGGDEGGREKLQNQEDVLKATVALRRPCRSGLPAGSATTSAETHGWGWVSSSLAAETLAHQLPPWRHHSLRRLWSGAVRTSWAPGAHRVTGEETRTTEFSLL